MLNITAAKDDTKDADYVGGAYVPHKFAREEFANRYSDNFDEFIELLAQGTPRDLAAIEAFEMVRYGIDMRNADQVGMAAEVNPYFKARYRKMLAAKDARRDMWTENDSINHLLRLVKDPRVRDATRLNAINALNVLCGYVQLDELTARRVGKTIADFERQNAAWVAAGSPRTVHQQTTH